MKKTVKGARELTKKAAIAYGVVRIFMGKGLMEKYGLLVLDIIIFSDFFTDVGVYFC